MSDGSPLLVSTPPVGSVATGGVEFGVDTSPAPLGGAAAASAGITAAVSMDDPSGSGGSGGVAIAGDSGGGRSLLHSSNIVSRDAGGRTNPHNALGAPLLSRVPPPAPHARVSYLDGIAPPALRPVSIAQIGAGSSSDAAAAAAAGSMSGASGVAKASRFNEPIIKLEVLGKPAIKAIIFATYTTIILCLVLGYVEEQHGNSDIVITLHKPNATEPIRPPAPVNASATPFFRNDYDYGDNAGLPRALAIARTDQSPFLTSVDLPRGMTTQCHTDSSLGDTRNYYTMRQWAPAATSSAAAVAELTEPVRHGGAALRAFGTSGGSTSSVVNGGGWYPSSDATFVLDFLSVNLYFNLRVTPYRNADSPYNVTTTTELPDGNTTSVTTTEFLPTVYRQLNLTLGIYGLDTSVPGVKWDTIYHDTFVVTFDCHAGELACKDIPIISANDYYLQFIYNNVRDYTTFNITVIEPDSSLWAYSDSLTYDFRYRTSGFAYTQMTLHTILCAVTVVGIVFWYWKLHSKGWSKLVPEQRWISGLLVALFFYQNPFFVPYVLYAQPKYRTLTDVSYVIASSYILTFWLMMMDGVRATSDSFGLNDKRKLIPAGSAASSSGSSTPLHSTAPPSPGGLGGLGRASSSSAGSRSVIGRPSSSSTPLAPGSSGGGGSGLGIEFLTIGLVNFFTAATQQNKWSLKGDQNKVYRYTWAFYLGKAIIGLGICACALSVVLLMQTTAPVNSDTNASSATASVGVQITAESPAAVLWLVVITVLFLLTWFVWLFRSTWRASDELKKLPYLATRYRQLSFRFFLVQTWLIILYFVLLFISSWVFPLTDATGGRTGLLSTALLLSVYIYLTAIVYLPVTDKDKKTGTDFFLDREAERIEKAEQAAAAAAAKAAIGDGSNGGDEKLPPALTRARSHSPTGEAPSPISAAGAIRARQAAAAAGAHRPRRLSSQARITSGGGGAGSGASGVMRATTTTILGAIGLDGLFESDGMDDVMHHRLSNFSLHTARWLVDFSWQAYFNPPIPAGAIEPQPSTPPAGAVEPGVALAPTAALTDGAAIPSPSAASAAAAAATTSAFGTLQRDEKEPASGAAAVSIIAANGPPATPFGSAPAAGTPISERHSKVVAAESPVRKSPASGAVPRSPTVVPTIAPDAADELGIGPAARYAAAHNASTAAGGSGDLPTPMSRPSASQSVSITVGGGDGASAGAGGGAGIGGDGVPARQQTFVQINSALSSVREDIGHGAKAANDTKSALTVDYTAAIRSATSFAVDAAPPAGVPTGPATDLLRADYVDLRESGYRQTFFWHNPQSDTACFVARKSWRVIVSFRGTVSLKNAKTDLSWTRVQNGHFPGLVHNGFSAAYESIRAELHAHLLTVKDEYENYRTEVLKREFDKHVTARRERAERRRAAAAQRRATATTADGLPIGDDVRYEARPKRVPNKKSSAKPARFATVTATGASGLKSERQRAGTTINSGTGTASAFRQRSAQNLSAALAAATDITDVKLKINSGTVSAPATPPAAGTSTAAAKTPSPLFGAVSAPSVAAGGTATAATTTTASPAPAVTSSPLAMFPSLNAHSYASLADAAPAGVAVSDAKITVSSEPTVASPLTGGGLDDGDWKDGDGGFDGDDVDDGDDPVFADEDADDDLDYRDTKIRPGVVEPLLVYFTGHSLGGALATLAAYECREVLRFEHVLLYNFGSPRVGDRVFATGYDEVVPLSFRVVFDRDMISTMPKMISMYKHVGMEIIIDGLGNFIIEASYVERMFMDSRRSISDHMMMSYIKGLDAALLHVTYMLNPNPIQHPLIT